MNKRKATRLCELERIELALVDAKRLRDFRGQQLIEKKIENVRREMALDELWQAGHDAGEYDGSN